VGEAHSWNRERREPRGIQQGRRAREQLRNGEVISSTPARQSCHVIVAENDIGHRWCSRSPKLRPAGPAVPCESGARCRRRPVPRARRYVVSSRPVGRKFRGLARPRHPEPLDHGGEASHRGMRIPARAPIVQSQRAAARTHQRERAVRPVRAGFKPIPARVVETSSRTSWAPRVGVPGAFSRRARSLPELDPPSTSTTGWHEADARESRASGASGRQARGSASFGRSARHQPPESSTGEHRGIGIRRR
jgi:hypothetical protein